MTGMSRAAGVASPSESSASLSRPLTWRMRSDLVIRPHEPAGWIIKDPLSLQYVTLSDPEFHVLQRLDGICSATDLLAELNSRPSQSQPAENYSAADVGDLLNQFVHSRLVRSTTVADFVGRRETPRRSALSWLKSATTVLSFRWPLIDPTSVLQHLDPLLSSVLSRRAVTAALCIIATAVVTVVVRFEQFVRELPGPADFFGTDNLVILLLVFIVVKTLHECGHACVARRMGAECHEAGLMFLMLTPVLYTNVTDAWILNRRSRMLITSAGMFVELLIAGICILLWSVAAPGLTRAILANTLVLCSVGTVLFNANPLVRFDGYFLLADAINRPNLARNASAELHRLGERLLLGSTPQRPERRDTVALAYGLASGVYRMVLVVAIGAMLVRVLESWNLRVVGIGLAGIAVVSMLVVPLAGFLSGAVAEGMSRKHPWRALSRAATVFGCILLIGLIPLPRSVSAPAVVEPNGHPVFVTLPGQLVRSVPYGTLLEPGAVVAELLDPVQQRRMIQLESEIRRHEIRVRAMELRRTPGDADDLPEARESLAASKARFEQFRAELRRLTITTPVAGRLMPPRHVDRVSDQSLLQGWHGTPLDPINSGALLRAGTLIGYIADPTSQVVRVHLSEDTTDVVTLNQTVRFLSSGGGNVLLTGVSNGEPQPMTEAASELMAEGLIAPPGTSARRSGSWSVLARFSLPDTNEGPPLYSTGMAGIQVHPESMISRLTRCVMSTFGHDS